MRHDNDSAIGSDVQATAVVRLSDLNGPRGGIDKRCKVQVRGARLCVVSEATDGDPNAAVDTARARPRKMR